MKLTTQILAAQVAEMQQRQQQLVQQDDLLQGEIRRLSAQRKLIQQNYSACNGAIQVIERLQATLAAPVPPKAAPKA